MGPWAPVCLTADEEQYARLARDITASPLVWLNYDARAGNKESDAHTFADSGTDAVEASVKKNSDAGASTAKKQVAKRQPQRPDTTLVPPPPPEMALLQLSAPVEGTLSKTNPVEALVDQAIESSTKALGLAPTRPSDKSAIHLPGQSKRQISGEALAQPPEPVLTPPSSLAATQSPNQASGEDQRVALIPPKATPNRLLPILFKSPSPKKDPSERFLTAQALPGGPPPLKLRTGPITPLPAESSPAPQVLQAEETPSGLDETEEEEFSGLPRDYRLGPGDQLSVIDPSLGTPEQPGTTTLAVAPDGTIVVYPVGVIRAGGLTIPQLTQIVNDKAKEFEENPHISIALAKERPINVYVLGDVVSPGLWNSRSTSSVDKEKATVDLMQQATPPLQSTNNQIPGLANIFNQTSIISASPQLKTPPATEPTQAPLIMTTLTAIQLAGGFRDSADITHVTVRKRSTHKVYVLDFWKLLIEGDFTQDVILQSGDVVFVPHGGPMFDGSRLGFAANQYRYVRVWGAVRAPGLYILGPHDDIFSIIARAGGFAPTADHSKVQVSRLNRDGTITDRVVSLNSALSGIDKVGRSEVQPGDVIIAKTSYVKQLGPPVLKAAAVTFGAALLLYFSYKWTNRSLKSTNASVAPVILP